MSVEELWLLCVYSDFNAGGERIVIMGKPIGFVEKVVLTGGVAKNIGIKKALEEEIGLEIEVP